MRRRRYTGPTNRGSNGRDPPESFGSHYYSAGSISARFAKSSVGQFSTILPLISRRDGWQKSCNDARHCLGPGPQLVCLSTFKGQGTTTHHLEPTIANGPSLEGQMVYFV